MNKSEKWLDISVELQALAQAGLEYSKDKYDIERFERIRELSAEMLSVCSELPKEKVDSLFCCEKGYKTPKIDTRAAIIENSKVLLVKENDGLWSLPGGWCDENKSTAENTAKESFEEAGLNVKVKTLVALQDRKKHNTPVYAYNICKVFYLCERISGEFKPNIETTESGWFSLDKLPKLAESKNTKEQIALCFEAAQQKEKWVTVFD